MPEWTQIPTDLLENLVERPEAFNAAMMGPTPSLEWNGIQQTLWGVHTFG